MNGNFSFGQWLRQRRKALDLTQETLAERVGCATITLRRIETEERRPSLIIAQNLADALEIPPGQIEAFLRLARGGLREEATAPSPPTSTPAASLSPTGVPSIALPLSVPSLPVPPTPLVERTHVVATVCELLDRADVRLLTLVGPPGIGKTRLALHVASERMATYTDGVAFVALSPVRDATQVAASIAQALGIGEIRGKMIETTLADTLRERCFLLVLDNFEHILPAAPVVADLLAHCPRLTVLVTSRAALHLSGEHEYLVPPLTLPARGVTTGVDPTTYGAVRLFIARAQAVHAGFVPTPEDLDAIIEICRRLDGLPLAIELAAARIKLLPPRALLNRLKDRLAVLTGGPRDLPTRQQTLRGAIAWSYDLLTLNEQRLFACLAVFSGGFGLDAVEAVMADGDLAGEDALDALASLLDHNLVVRLDGAGGEPRIVMLSVMRDFARECLVASGKLDAFQERHAIYYLGVAEEAEPHMRTAQAQAQIARLATERYNMRVALRWALERQDARLGLRLVAALSRFWEMRGYLTEGREWPEQVLALRGENSDPEFRLLRAKVLSSTGVLAYRQSDYETAAALQEESLAIFRELGEQQRVGSALNNLALIAMDQGNYPRATALHEESLHLKRMMGDERGIAVSLANLGMIAGALGEHDRAVALTEESLVLYRRIGEQWGIAMALTNLGEVARRQGAYAQARSFIEDAIAIHRTLASSWSEAYACIKLGQVALAQRDFVWATALYTDALRLSQLADFASGFPWCFEGFAHIALAHDEPERAARLFGAAANLRATVRAIIPPADQVAHEAAIAVTRDRLGEGAFASVWAAGAVLALSQAIVEALTPPAQMALTTIR